MANIPQLPSPGNSETAAAAAKRVLSAKVVDAAVGRRALILTAALRRMEGCAAEAILDRVIQLRRDPRRAVEVLENFRRTAGAA